MHAFQAACQSVSAAEKPINIFSLINIVSFCLGSFPFMVQAKADFPSGGEAVAGPSNLILLSRSRLADKAHGLTVCNYQHIATFIPT